MTWVAVCECPDISTGGKTEKLGYKEGAFGEVTTDVVRVVVWTGSSVLPHTASAMKCQVIGFRARRGAWPGKPQAKNPSPSKRKIQRQALVFASRERNEGCRESIIRFARPAA